MNGEPRKKWVKIWYKSYNRLESFIYMHQIYEYIL